MKTKLLYDLKIPANNQNGYYDLFVETNGEMSLEELKNELIKSDKVDMDLKEDIEFATDYNLENYYMKFFFIKNGFKVIEL